MIIFTVIGTISYCNEEGERVILASEGNTLKVLKQLISGRLAVTNMQTDVEFEVDSDTLDYLALD